MQNSREAFFRQTATFISRLAVAAAFLVALSPSSTQSVVANGETRTINLYHTHTHEQISATYLVNGQYDQSVLKQLNWFLRDWRRDEPTTMDPRLFDVVWEAYRHAGASEAIHIVSAYRSPETNAMLRRRSRAVAKYSQHMLGKAMDTTMPGMTMSRIREIGMRMQRGGVGYYPTAGTPFVHLDVGSVRSWPRMSYDQLARLFPDGKTVHLPTNGQPLARYEEAKAEIEARGGGAYVPAERRSRGFLAFLFGGGGEDEEDSGEAAPAPSTRKQWASLAPRAARSSRGAAIESEEEGGATVSDAGGRKAASESLTRAQSDLPKGETQLTAPAANASGANAPAPMPPARPSPLEKANHGRTVVAALESGAELAQSDQGGEEERISAPLPPRRPHGLAILASTAPLPPARPVELASVNDIAPANKKKFSPSVEKKEKDVNASAALAHLVDVTGSTGTRPALALSAPQTLRDSGGDAQGASETEAGGGSDEAVLAYTQTPVRAADLHSEAPTGLRAASKSVGKTDEKRDRPTLAHVDQTVSNAAPSASRVSGASVFGPALSAPRLAARAAQEAARRESQAAPRPEDQHN